MILLDTSGLLAWIDAGQNRHLEVVKAMEKAVGPYLLSPFVLAELDYLLATWVGVEARYSMLHEVERGAFRLTPFARADIGLARSIMEQYHGMDIGLADASIVVLAERHKAYKILTLDERHFRVVTTASGKPFTLLPADA